MASKININLDTSKENYLVTKCKQNDNLTLEAFIYENGLALDLTNKTITIQALKSDNTYIIQNTDIVKENNKINAELDRDFSRVPGTTKIEIVLVESSKQNTTFSFYLEVVGSVIRGAVQSSNTATILEALDNKIVEAGVVKEETEQLIESGGAAKKEDIININASLEQSKQELFYMNKDFKTPIPTVVFITDDGATGDQTKLKPISEQYNVPFCSAVYDGCPNTPNLKSLQDDLGWEICGHNQFNLGNKTEEEVRVELEKTINFCKRNGLKLKNHVYAEGVHSPIIRRVVLDYFRSACQVGGGINTPPLMQYNLSRVALGSFFDGLDITGQGLVTSTLEYYKACVDKTVKEKGLCIFMLHPNEPLHDEVQQQNIKDLILYCKQQSVNITTLDKALDIFSNRKIVGDYWDRVQSDNYYIIGANGKVSSKNFGNELIDRVYINNNNINNTTLLTEFPNGTSIKGFLVSDNAGFPTQAGTLETYKDFRKYSQLSYQLWYAFNSQDIYRRNWGGSWGSWVKINGDSSTVELIKILSLNAVNSTTAITDFDNKKISICQISGANTNGFPNNIGGQLYTYRFNSDNGWQHQEFEQQNTHRKYKRYVKSDGSWSDWLELVSKPTTVVIDNVSFGAIPSYSTKDIEVDVLGCTIYDIPSATPYLTLESGLTWSCFIPSGGKVKIRLSNCTNATITPSSRTWRVTAIKS